MSEKRAKVIIEVVSGIIPGQPIEQYTRRWVLTFEEVQDRQTYLDAQGAAMNYAMWLQQPQLVNWVRLEWVWL